MLLKNETPSKHRERCYVCYRPKPLCFCHRIPSISNRTHILILQHVKERFHAFNTARIVRQALQNSTLVVDQTSRMATMNLPFRENTGVLFPGTGSRQLCDVPASERPEQLVILDGTWHHAKTLIREIPALGRLPRFGLEPAAPSNYRIRKEPNDSAISTLEATVEALRTLEPEITGLDELVQAFDHMIDAQIPFTGHSGRVRKTSRPTAAPANIPYVLVDDIQDVVVVYGEASHYRNDQSGPRHPVYWVAERLGTHETFECAIRSPVIEDADFLRHLELSSTDFDNACSVAEFRSLWKKYLKPNDTIAAFNQGTLRLLKSTAAECPQSINLKSVDIARDCSTLDDVLRSLQLKPPRVAQKGRAGQRLANAIAYATWLHHYGQSATPNTSEEMSPQ